MQRRPAASFGFSVLAAFLCACSLHADAASDLIRSAKSGPWSSSDTWEGNKVPGPASKVQIREGHSILYDVGKGPAIRMIHVAGTLNFARDRDTQLDVGLIK